MKSENCEPIWRESFQKVLRKLKESATTNLDNRVGKKRVAVILPGEYRRGELRGAKLLARAIFTGSRAEGNDVEVVFAHLNDPGCYSDEIFADFSDSIGRRPYHWRLVSHAEAVRGSAYAGLQHQSEALAGISGNLQYIIPDDGISQLTDCDLWIVVSDRLNYPLLPLRPYLLMVNGYLQRYQLILDDQTSQQYVRSARVAEAILVTTEFAARDARQYAGIPANRIKKVPMLAPESPVKKSILSLTKLPRYFIWTTNLDPQKNHENAFKALQLYYEKYAGSLECRVTGFDVKDMLKLDVQHLNSLREIRRASRMLRKSLKFDGDLSDRNFQIAVQGAAFLWHPSRIDNGTFSVVEAAHLDVPALSSDYPAMREIDGQFSLGMTWADPEDPDDMAQKLKYMEANFEKSRDRLPPASVLASQSVDRLAGAYWNVIRNYL